MEAASPSRTAMLTAVQRGVHRLIDDEPWVVDDPFALSLVGDSWPEVAQRLDTAPDVVPVRRGRALLLARARSAEDRVLDGRRSFEQYVILGAGLDSFAWRRPDVLRHGLRVFEIDHPASQTWKRARARELALPVNDRHRFAPCDFETTSLTESLDAAGFDWQQRTLFSWLGVSMYLTTDAIEATLRTVTACVPTSEIVWTYWPPLELIDAADQDWREGIAARADDAGEPIVTTLHPDTAETLSSRCGLPVVDHPDARELHRRYFEGRRDGLSPSSAERVIVSRTPPR